jgi:hypothetical protein
MNHLKFLILILGLTFICCNQNGKSILKTDKPSKSLRDKTEIQKLIKDVLTWSNTKETIDLLPVISDNKDSVYSFDMNKHKSNLDKLKKANFFTNEFIDNYNQIILTIDKNLRIGIYDKWLVGDLPTFIFANDYVPWWDGQERFSLDWADIEIINLNITSGEFYFVCGAKGTNCDGMEDYKMKFRVVRVDSIWKISYLEGFDYKESIRKDGEL